MAYINGKKLLQVARTQNVFGTMEEIKDANGNLRFVEGNGSPATINGVTTIYSKWSLSGTHLMCVHCFKVDSSTTLSSQSLVSFAIPQYILDKVQPLVTALGFIEPKTVKGYSDELDISLNLDTSIRKASNRLDIYIGSVTTTTKAITFRIQFDLLIDNE